MKLSLIKAIKTHFDNATTLSGLGGLWEDLYPENIKTFPRAVVMTIGSDAPDYSFGGVYVQKTLVRISVYSTDGASTINTIHKAVQTAFDWSYGLTLDDGTHLSSIRQRDMIQQTHLKSPDGKQVWMSQNNFYFSVYDAN